MAMGLSSSSGSRRAGRRSRRAAMAEINVTPLVDVMLVLLIIFMVTVTLPAVGVPIELPDSRANPAPEAPDQVNITINREGQIFVEEDPVPAGGFADALAAIDRGADGEYPVIVLRGDENLDYGRVMAVLGELNRAGITRITQVTDSSDSVP